MRVECERCHALVAADFEVDLDGVTASCGACGATFRAEARRRPVPAAAPASVDAGPGCVKCGAPLTDDVACPRCGLARERAGAWAASEPEPAPELVGAWAAAEAAWDDPAAHDRAAAVALAQRGLPWLARRYRDAERARPADAVARARIDRIAFMSLAALKATAGPPVSPRARGRAAYLVLLLVAVAMVGALVAARATAVKRGEGKRRPAVPADRVDRADRARLRAPAPAPAAPSIERAGSGR